MISNSFPTPIKDNAATQVRAEFRLEHLSLRVAGQFKANQSERISVLNTSNFWDHIKIIPLSFLSI